MRGRRRAVVLAGALALVLGAGPTLAACGVPSNDRARVVDPADVPEQLLGTSTTLPTTAPGDATPPSPPPASDPVQLFFVRDERLVPVTRRLPLPLAVDDALAALVAGPDAEAKADGLTSALGEGTPTVTSQGADGVVVVELSRGTVEGGGQVQRLAIAQIVYTVTGLPGASSVRFTLDGDAVSVPRGDGTLAPRETPVDRADYAELLATA
jgi:spore germination protein GerM